MQKIPLLSHLYSPTCYFDNSTTLIDAVKRINVDTLVLNAEGELILKVSVYWIGRGHICVECVKNIYDLNAIYYPRQVRCNYCY